MKLYEIAKEYQAFLDAVEAGDIPEEAIGDTLDGIVGEFDQKADNIACAIKGYMAEAEAIKKEEGALRERRDSKMRKVDQMKHYLSEQMQKMGKKKLETERNLLSFRKSTALIIENEEDFKQRHGDLCKREVVVSIPKKEITDRLKAGEEISGAVLQERQNLQIK